MNVENAIGKCLEQRRPDQPHVPGQANQIDLARAKDLDDGAIVRVAIGVVGRRQSQSPRRRRRERASDPQRPRDSR